MEPQDSPMRRDVDGRPAAGGAPGVRSAYVSMTPGSVSPRALFGVRGFSALFAALSLGAFNDNVFKTAFVSLLTYRLAADLTLDAATLVALANGVFILPFALLSPLAGQIADRVDKAAMMRVVKGLEVLLMLGAYYAYSTQSVGALYGLVFAMGLQSALFGPIKFGVLPVYLRGDEMVRGNGLIQAATFLAILLGTLVGANLILAPNGAAWVSGLAVAVAGLGFVASLFATPAPPAPAAAAERVGPARRDLLVGAAAAAGVGGALWALDPAPALGSERVALAGAALCLALAGVARPIGGAVSAAASVPGVLPTILCISWFWFAGATFLTLIVPLAAESFGGDASVLTLLLAAFSVGVALGSVLVGALLRGAARVGPAPLGALGIAVLSLAFWALAAGAPARPADAAPIDAAAFAASPLGVSVLLVFVGLAICAGVYVTPLNAVYQSRARSDARGRTVAAAAMFDSAFMAVSAVLIVALTALSFTPPQICAMIGATGALAAAATWWTARSGPPSEEDRR